MCGSETGLLQEPAVSAGPHTASSYDDSAPPSQARCFAEWASERISSKSHLKAKRDGLGPQQHERKAVMIEPLRIYLNDHLGGAEIALELLEAMRDQHDDPESRDFARTLLPEIQKDERMHPTNPILSVIFGLC